MKTSRHLLCWIAAAALTAAPVLLAAPSCSRPAGKTVPSFTGRDQDGSYWKLSDHIGKKVLFLYFSPKTTRPVHDRACSLRDNMPELKQAGGRGGRQF